ncbi:dephospho-CoA kinase [Pelomicrobium sp.]|jgi:dephospho-CoA kinase|uniref:dephospho-CoA kinase n=1 Tax=Pelomicrobium sp. TaxID=2815319 RepID=UPI002FDEE917
MTFVVGLTGGIGSGKSTVARHFEALGVSIVDTDAIAHALTGAGGEAIPALRKAFGDAYLTSEGALDRARMRCLVFADPLAKERLQAILHPQIWARAEAAIARSTGPYVVLVVPLLLEAGSYADRVDRILVVDCSEEQQIRRTMLRSGLDEAAVRAILAAQVSRAERLSRADDVIDNSGPEEALGPQVEALHRKYLALSAQARAQSDL